jgi:hypothetical protein
MPLPIGLKKHTNVTEKCSGYFLSDEMKNWLITLELFENPPIMPG